MNKQINLSKIGIIGDVHAELSYLSHALSYLDGLSLQAILCTGDVVDGPENVDNCCDLLKQHKVFTVRGNHDNWFSSNLMRELPESTLAAHLSNESQEYLQSLPLIQEFQTNQGRLLLCHGIGKKDMGRVTPDDYGYSLDMNFELQAMVTSKHYRFMVNGHTHQRMVRTFGGLTVINAGSLQRPRLPFFMTEDFRPGSLNHRHMPCFLTADFESGRVQYYAIHASGGIEKMEETIISAVKSETLNSRYGRN